MDIQLAKRLTRAMSRFPHPWILTALLIVVAVGTPSNASQTCRVPGLHSTIQRAIDDAGCSEIVLEAGVFSESVSIGRSLKLEGDAVDETTLEGRIVIAGAETLVSLSNLVVDSSCADPIDNRGGSQVALSAVDISHSSSTPCAN